MAPAWRVDVITTFPESFAGFLDVSLLGKARAAGIVDVRVHNLRDWAQPPHRITDDYAYGGGPGMVLKAEPITAAVEDLRGSDSRVSLLTPQGRPLTQSRVAKLAARPHLILICGRYEGVDERVRTLVVDEEISVGDYVLSGGEVAAMVVIDAAARLVPGVVGDSSSLVGESHADGRLSHPQFTRPEEFRGLRAPPVLLSGHHARVERWRRAQALHRTQRQRPDLLDRRALSDEERQLMDEFPSSDP
jgi:tRNA (guanine37-N1)-methyltransferase